MAKYNSILRALIKLLIHFSFWGFVLLFYTYFFGYGSNNKEYVFKFSLFLMPITIGLTYYIVLTLIPKYFITKRYLRFAVYTIYALVISFYLVVVSVYYGLIFLSDFEYKSMAPVSRSILFVMIGIYLVVAVVSVFALLQYYYKAMIEKSTLETKMLNTSLKLKNQELDFLKMQLQPHFLFNSLNTIYSLSLNKRSETPEVILQLSDLLDYLLYNTNKPHIDINDEIKILLDYIAIEKMRFEDILDVNTDIQSSSHPFYIAPLILLPFVENSFKHGAIVHDKLNMDIHLSLNNEWLCFKITNNYNKTAEIKPGIGLKNIKKRLELIYPNTHNLQIDIKDSLFLVSLKLKSLRADG